MERPSKRARSLSESLARARDTTKKIKGLDLSRFSNPGVATVLPYPALDHVYAGVRPGRVVQFVGRGKLYPALIHCVLNPVLKYRERVYKEYRGVVITGPRGSGKSCLLRAIACELIATLGEGVKVICLWHISVEKRLDEQFQDALLFTYCNECEADAGLARQICGIHDPEALSEFLADRRALGEKFYVVTDGEERLDAFTSQDSATRRAIARDWLAAAREQARIVVKTLSPKAEEAMTNTYGLLKWPVGELFQKTEVETYLAGSPLGRLLEKRPKRWSEVDFFVGRHPLSLWCLDVCCVEYVLEKGGALAGTDLDWVPLFKKDNWSSVMASFRCGELFSEIRNKFWAESQSFRLGDEFCSDYIRTVCMEAEKKNVEARKYRCAELTQYVDMMLKRGVHFRNWPALGWACEAFVGDAVLKAGLIISGLERLVPTSVVIIYGGQPMELKGEVKPGESAYWTPGRYSFKYIDGLILHRDKQGTLHLIALQDTVDPANHRSTEHKFMQERHLRKWWANAEAIQLHYVYMCPQMPATMERKAKVKKGEVVVADLKAEVDYWVHVEPMEDCIPKLSDQEYSLLRRLGDARGEALRKRADEKREHMNE